ncbi:MAG: DUF480 domain-containing protein [Jatrophihabitans sp.]|uniref:DUF480 domain-containing protein n=1 Tax=Jatrophihabitans sp. TaxID=1932789 RepID=UPI003F7E1CEF
MELPVLDATEQRIVGSLLEKQVTVPAGYPMTLNALRTACNQATSRDPVTDLDDRTVEQTARALKDRGLARIVWAGAGSRTLKYHQTLTEVLELGADERALLTVLLLRGPQTAGELKTRTERLHPFADKAAAEQTLLALADRGLVRELPRRPGHHDNRWIHLLGPIAESAPAIDDDPVDRESVLASGGEVRDERVRATYASVADAYADRLVDELAELPFERWLLHHVARLAGDHPIVEVGCGPGHVTAFLADAGNDAVGIDLTPAMVDEARRRFPDGDYQVGDLRSLMRPRNDDGWGAVLAWYSLIHLAASELPGAVTSLARPTRSDGWVLAALHAGAGIRHLDAWFERSVDVDVVLHDPAAVRAAVEGAGLVDLEWYHRGPYAARGETTERLYVLGRKQ